MASREWTAQKVERPEAGCKPVLRFGGGRSFI